MISSAFNTVLYEPFYNALLFLSSVVPFADIGIAVVLLTIFVKVVLLPLTHKSTKTQVKMRVIEPEMKKIREEYKDNKEEQARKIMELYRAHEVNPFVGCLVVLIQIPIILALYWVFWRGLSIDPALAETLPKMAGFINTDLLNQTILYPFVTLPDFIKVDFLGLIDMTGKSALLAVIAGVSQYYQIKLSLPHDGDAGFFPKPTGNIKEDLAQNMKFQMRYILPVVVAVIAYTISAAVALYWATSNIFTIIHELFVKRGAEKEAQKA